MDSNSYELFIEAKKEKDVEAMKEVYLINPYDSRISYEYAILLIDNENLDEAEKLLLNLVKTGTEKDKNMSLMQLGRLEIKRNNLEKAKIYFINLLCSKNKKDNLMASFYLGKIAELEGDYDEAEECFNEVIENDNLTDKEKSFSKLELGRVKVLKHEYESAREIFTNSVLYGNDQEKYNALFELSKLSTIEEKYDKTLEELKELLTSNNPKDKSCAYHSMGKIYGFLGQYDEAEKCFNILKEIGSYLDRTYAYRYLVILEIKRNNLEKALEHLIEARRNKVKVAFKDKFYVCKNLNVFFKNNHLVLPTYSYVEEQILDYDPYLAMEVIIDNKKENAKFNSDVDIVRLFNEIKSYLVEDYKRNDLVTNDRYIIPYYNVGLNGENYLFVETIANSKDILNMYPVKSNNLKIDEEENIRKRV